MGGASHSRIGNSSKPSKRVTLLGGHGAHLKDAATNGGSPNYGGVSVWILTIGLMHGWPWARTQEYNLRKFGFDFWLRLKTPQSNQTCYVRSQVTGHRVPVKGVLIHNSDGIVTKDNHIQATKDVSHHR
jgi:hypothetical protein